MFKLGANFRRTAVLGLVAGASTLSAGCGVSTQQEIDIGRQYAAQINQQLPIVTDPQINNYINLVGNTLARQGTRDLPYQFYVVNINQVNAFAVPGGFIYINRGLIERAENLSELAGVLAHEVAHVEARHSAEMIERAQRANIGLNVAYILLGRPPSGLEQAAIEIGGTAWMASHSRSAEMEADALAVRYMVGAGLDPNGLVTFFRKLLDDQQRQPGRVEQWFATHPTTADRVAETQALIAQVPAAHRQNLTTNTEQFRAFQQRVRQLPAPPARFR
jgi:beta-barrel assembly-enhancing protease